MEEIEKKLYSDDNVEVTTFKCPNCGGGSVFDAKTQKMKCLYCGSFFEVENEDKAEERKLEELLDKSEVWTEAEVYQCQSCGAKEIVDNQEVSHICPFCRTKNVIKVEQLPRLKPQGIIPFKIDKKTASLNATKFVRKKLYAPRKFKKSAKTENLHGVYNPVFTFDSTTQSDYHGQLGKYYTVTRHINGKVVTETRTRVFNIQGDIDKTFDDLLVQASSIIPIDIVNRLQPFSTKNALAYKPEYLIGFGANTYNKEGKECWEEGKEIIKNSIENSILKRYNYDVKYSLSVNTKFLSASYKYILVPIYVGNYRYRNKIYNFFVNGENGKVAGKTPVSAGKVCLTVFVILLLIAGIILLYIFS